MSDYRMRVRTQIPLSRWQAGAPGDLRNCLMETDAANRIGISLERIEFAVSRRAFSDTDSTFRKD
jgi:hypothetical protein